MCLSTPNVFINLKHEESKHYFVPWFSVLQQAKV